MEGTAPPPSWVCCEQDNAKEGMRRLGIIPIACSQFDCQMRYKEFVMNTQVQHPINRTLRIHVESQEFPGSNGCAQSYSKPSFQLEMELVCLAQAHSCLEDCRGEGLGRRQVFFIFLCLSALQFNALELQREVT